MSEMTDDGIKAIADKVEAVLAERDLGMVDKESISMALEIVHLRNKIKEQERGIKMLQEELNRRP